MKKAQMKKLLQSNTSVTKTSHISLKVPNGSKKVFEEIIDGITGDKKLISEEFIEDLARQSVQSALNKKNDIKAMGFFLRLGYGSDSIKRWSERSEKFKRLYEQRKDIIGLKRETGAGLKDFDEDKEYIRLNENFIRLSMPLYDPEWIENEKRIAALNKESEKPAIQYVVIPEFPKE
jgi:hypothetical protein